MRRVVITGLGLVTPLACGVEASWKRLIEGESGLGPITHFDPSAMPCQVAAQVPVGDGDGDFNVDDWVDSREQRRNDPFIIFGLTAA